MTTTLTSREFNRNPSAAKRKAETEPVIITDRGKPRFVLMGYDAYRERSPASPSSGRSILDRLAATQGDELAFEPPRMEGPYTRPIDLE